MRCKVLPLCRPQSGPAHGSPIYQAWASRIRSSCKTVAQGDEKSQRLHRSSTTINKSTPCRSYSRTSMFSSRSFHVYSSCRAHIRAACSRPRRAIIAQPSAMSSADKPIKNVLLVIAMQAEAEPIVEELGLKKDEETPYAPRWSVPHDAALCGGPASVLNCS